MMNVERERIMGSKEEREWERRDITKILEK